MISQSDARLILLKEKLSLMMSQRLFNKNYIKNVLEG